ncbi:MAG: hypothetical protein ACO4A0_11550, partial [Ilumatobacteraceae bacterium]
DSLSTITYAPHDEVHHTYRAVKDRLSVARIVSEDAVPPTGNRPAAPDAARVRRPKGARHG